MKLHHRVALKSDMRHGFRLWFWTCPACDMTGCGSSPLSLAHRMGTAHAIGCDRLRELNRQTAYGCRNCDGTGKAGGDWCVVCLGRGWWV